MKRSAWFGIGFFILLITLATAVDLIPQGDINGVGIRKIFNFTNITATKFCDTGGSCYTLSTLNGSAGGNTTTQMQTAINTSVFYQILTDWTNLQSIPAGFADDVDNDTTYSALSEFTDDLGSRGYTALSNFTNDGVFITNATMNTSVDCSNIDGATSNLCTLVDTDTTYTVLSNFTNDLGFVTNTTMNQSVDHSNIDNFPSNCSVGTFQIGDAAGTRYCASVTGFITDSIDDTATANYTFSGSVNVTGTLHSPGNTSFGFDDDNFIAQVSAAGTTGFGWFYDGTSSGSSETYALKGGFSSISNWGEYITVRRDVGFVGINDTFPGEILEVGGDIELTGDLELDVGNGLNLNDSNTNVNVYMNTSGCVIITGAGGGTLAVC